MLNTRLVKWDELLETFHSLFPRTIADVIDGDSAMPAKVTYVGQIFEIRPVLAPHFGSNHCTFIITGIEIWGPAHINTFPDSHAVPLPLQM